ncbi:MAG: hypothetical protein M3133_06800 [Actinomycetota bacterium]|nr:hypothetical protein [Actinomycetota bacterium]
MEAASLDRQQGEGKRAEPRGRPLWARTVLAVALTAGVAAGAAMIGTQMAIGEIASEETAVPGIRSSTWTAVTSISAFLFGEDAFHGSFAVLPVLFGLAWHFLNAVVLGVIGVALVLVTLGARPGPLASAVLGFSYGLFLQVAVLNLAVNAIDDPNIVYESTPEWSWWLAHAVYGTTLGLVASWGLRRSAS